MCSTFYCDIRLIQHFPLAKKNWRGVQSWKLLLERILHSPVLLFSCYMKSSVWNARALSCLFLRESDTLLDIYRLKRCRKLSSPWCRSMSLDICASARLGMSDYKDETLSLAMHSRCYSTAKVNDERPFNLKQKF